MFLSWHKGKSRNNRSQKNTSYKEKYSHDGLIVLIQSGFFPLKNIKFRIATDFPVAVKSANRLLPRGTINDNTRCTSFVIAYERLFRGKTLV
jgi:hypothetical protein